MCVVIRVQKICASNQEARLGRLILCEMIAAKVSMQVPNVSVMTDFEIQAVFKKNGLMQASVEVVVKTFAMKAKAKIDTKSTVKRFPDLLACRSSPAAATDTPVQAPKYRTK